jgi:hypothetical protein
VTRSRDAPSSARRSWQRPSVSPLSVTIFRRAQAVVGCLFLQLDVRLDFRNLRPRDADAPAASDSARDPSQQACPVRPHARAAEDRDDFGVFAGSSLDDEVVHVAAAAPVAVEELVVEHAEGEIELFAHDCPTLVRIIRGIAESDTARMITK